MINLTYTGMCENCKCAELELDCIEYQGFDGTLRDWTVRCVHTHACDAMEDRMNEKFLKDGDTQ